MSRRSDGKDLGAPAMRTIASGADGRVNQELADRLPIEDARRGRCGRCERKKRPSFCLQRNTMLGTSDVPRRRCAWEGVSKVAREMDRTLIMTRLTVLDVAGARGLSRE